MNLPKRRINPELLLSISATFLSLAALVVSIFQTKIAREQQQASVWPHLQTNYTKINDEFAFSVVNNGVGPAIIKSVRIEYKGKRYKDFRQLVDEQIQQLIRKNRTETDITVKSMYGSVALGDVIKNDGELRFGRVSNNEPLAQALLEIIQSPLYRIIVVYSDVYGNCWQLDRDAVTPLSKCPN